MKKYKVYMTIGITYGYDVTAVFTIDAECEACAKAVVMNIINSFYTRDGDAYITEVKEIV